MAEFLSILIIGLVFFVINLIWMGIKKIKMKTQLQAEPELYEVGYKKITVYRLKELLDGNRVIVAKAVTKQGTKLNDDQIIELSKLLGDGVAEIDCYESSYTSSKYAYFHNGHVYFN